MDTYIPPSILHRYIYPTFHLLSIHLSPSDIATTITTNHTYPTLPYYFISLSMLKIPMMNIRQDRDGDGDKGIGNKCSSSSSGSCSSLSLSLSRTN